MATWHILGAGSMGCLWASLLEARGSAVTLLLKDRAIAEVYRAEGGVTLERDGLLHHYHFPARVVGELATPDAEPPPRSLLVSTKAYDTVAALEGMRALLPRYQAIVLIQNGMGTVGEVTVAFPDLPLYVGVTAHGAYRRSRFHIVHAGTGATWIGPGTAHHERLSRATVADLLEVDGQVSWDAGILRRMWVKLAINCVINGLTVVHDCRNGEIVNDPLRSRMVALCAEAQRVLTAVLDVPDALNVLEEVTRVAEATRANYSSMLQDVRQGKRTEVEYINGYLCRTAQDLGIAIPEQQALLRQLRARMHA